MARRRVSARATRGAARSGGSPRLGRPLRDLAPAAIHYLFQRIKLDWFHQVGVEACRHRPLLIFRAAVTAECYDRNQRVRGLDALNDFISADSRKTDIEHDQIRLKPIDLFEPSLRRVYGLHFLAVDLE